MKRGLFECSFRAKGEKLEASGLTHRGKSTLANLKPGLQGSRKVGITIWYTERCVGLKLAQG